MRTILLAALLSACLSPAVRAEDAPRSELKAKWSALKTWFQHFKEGLDESVLSDEYQKTDITAVAAVRGAQQEAAEPDKVYWKSGARDKRVKELKAQKAELASALQNILGGKIKEGKDGLDAFEKAHPRSPLLADVRQARQKAKELEEASVGQQ